MFLTCMASSCLWRCLSASSQSRAEFCSGNTSNMMWAALRRTSLLQTFSEIKIKSTSQFAHFSEKNTKQKWEIWLIHLSDTENKIELETVLAFFLHSL